MAMLHSSTPPPIRANPRPRARRGLRRTRPLAPTPAREPRRDGRSSVCSRQRLGRSEHLGTRARARVVAAARGVGLAEGARGGDARGGLLGGAAGAAGVGFAVRTGKSAHLGARRVTARARSHRGASCACCGVPKLDTRLDEREDRRKKRNRCPSAKNSLTGNRSSRTQKQDPRTKTNARGPKQGPRAKKKQKEARLP